MRQIAVLLADGFEEIEAVTVIDVLRRADMEVVMVGVGNEMGVLGAHGIPIGVDCLIDDVEPGAFCLVVLPGGMPGSKNLAENERVHTLVRSVWDGGGHVAAICAAPIALHAAGMLEGRRVTAYPSVESQLTGAVYTGARLEVDERIVTSKGPGTAMEFALALVRIMGKGETEKQLREAMLIGA
ncbi:MAG: hypothetical protein A3K19_20815 [Lentisphaerae bacterium RIFOXYB12_FULL_65_16]|nr:MAG: hypothetical protein A3K18_19240 [Lentisphaerae bacterium RIFOXYA12_64_32]OGV85201.1 MAG: hypothetical protein A3K19_20815 [Lentisphaerae bacterium RIFOXYB12_FULL_65_16]